MFDHPCGMPITNQPSNGIQTIHDRNPFVLVALPATVPFERKRRHPPSSDCETWYNDNGDKENVDPRTATVHFMYIHSECGGCDTYGNENRSKYSHCASTYEQWAARCSLRGLQVFNLLPSSIDCLESCRLQRPTWTCCSIRIRPSSRRALLTTRRYLSISNLASLPTWSCSLTRMSNETKSIVLSNQVSDSSISSVKRLAKLSILDPCSRSQP